MARHLCDLYDILIIREQSSLLAAGLCNRLGEMVTTAHHDHATGNTALSTAVIMSFDMALPPLPPSEHEAEKAFFQLLYDGRFDQIRQFLDNHAKRQPIGRTHQDNERAS